MGCFQRRRSFIKHEGHENVKFNQLFAKGDQINYFCRFRNHIPVNF